MKRAFWFLIIALLMAFIVQPNLTAMDQETQRTPVNTTSSAKTNDNIDLGISDSKATICLDAANGGTDSGYITSDGIREKDLNLAIVQQLGKYLEECEYNVVYTRNDDSTIGDVQSDDSSQQRIQIAKDNNADYLISIQLADDVDTSMRGYSFFTHPKDKLINLANQMDENLMAINYSRFDGLDSDHYENFPILKDQDMPTILIQLGYMTNAQDLQNLENEEFQNMIARALAEAILTEIN